MIFLPITNTILITSDLFFLFVLQFAAHLTTKQDKKKKVGDAKKGSRIVDMVRGGGEMERETDRKRESAREREREREREGGGGGR